MELNKELLEEWVPIKGREREYMISNLGRIKSLKRYVNHYRGKRTVNERILNPTIYNNGYYCVMLGSGAKKMLLHRLIAIHFIPNPNNYPCINHKDGNKLNNDLSNLEWCSYQTNNKHAHETGLKKATWTGIRSYDNPNSKTILQLDLGGNIINEFGSQHEAMRQTGINNRDISHVCLNKSKTAGGYGWKFKDNNI